MEEWRDIPGYEGLYQVSSLGRIKSLDRIVIRGGRKHSIKGCLIKQSDNGAGYMMVGLHKDGVVKTAYVHRAVAMAFVQNPDNRPVVNHIDYNTKNNTPENLEWVYQGENLEHSKCHQPRARRSWKASNTGEKHIYRKIKHGNVRYCVEFRIDRKLHQRSFRTLDDAIRYRDYAVKEFGHYEYQHYAE